MTFTQPFADYEILARVGSGAMGTVFKARQKKLDRIVALKVLKPALARDARYVDRLRREARIVGALNHPNIVAGFDLGEEGGYHYFVMEFVDGRSLKDLLREWGSFPEVQVLDVAVQVGHALDHAWQKGVIHRDIKPANILIDQKGRVKLTDMGLAKGPEDLTITREGATVGTPQYISPEQARDPQSVDIRSDLYSLGATLFHMATGIPPFSAQTTGQMIAKLLNERAPSVCELNPAVSSGLSLVIRKLLAKDPALRYQAPGELLADLGRVQRQEPPAIDVRSLDRAEPTRASRKGLVAALAAALVVAGVGAGWALLASREAPPKADPGPALLARLEAQVAEAKGMAAAWRVLDSAEAAATGAVRAQVRSRRERHEQTWRTEIDELVQAQMAHASAFLADPKRWRDERAFFPEVVEPALRDRLGCRPAELPPPLREQYDASVAQQRQLVERLARDRDAAHLALFKSHLEGAQRTVFERFLGGEDQPDFRAAEVALVAALRDWHGQDGRPARHQLPESLGQQCDKLEQEMLQGSRRRILAEEDRAVLDLKGELDETLDGLKERVDQDDPKVIQKIYEQFKKELPRHHPPPSAFRQPADPWPYVASKQNAFESRLTNAIRQTDLRRFEDRLVAAYAALLGDGEAKKETPMLSHLQLQDEEVIARQARHLRLLACAEEAGQLLLARRLAGKSSALVPSSRSAGLIRLEKDGDRVVASRVASAKPEPEGLRIPMHELPWSDWSAEAEKMLGAEPAPERKAALARGVAVWLVVARSQKLQFVESEDERNFFSTELPGVIDAARLYLARGDRADLSLAHAELRALSQEKEPGKVKEALASWEKHYGSTALAPEVLRDLRDLRTWLKREERAHEVRAALKNVVPPGSEVELSAEGAFRLVIPAAALEFLKSAPGTEDFTVASGELLARVATGEGAFALRVLSITGDVPPGCEPSRITVAMRWPEAGPEPRVMMLSWAGVAAVLEPLPGHGLAAALLPSGSLEKPEVLRLALQTPLAEALTKPKARVVPGARHEVVLELGKTGRGTSIEARVLLDGTRLRKEDAIVRVNPLERGELRCTGGILVCRVEVEGRWN